MALSSITTIPLISGCERNLTLDMAGHTYPGYEFLHIANQFNWLNNNELNLIKTQSAGESMDAILKNKVQAAQLTLDEVLRLCDKGLDIQIVLIFNFSMGADVVLSQPNIIGLQNIKGKRIGFEKNTSGEIVLHEFIKSAGLTIEDIRPIHFPTNNHIQGWIRDFYDLVITQEPVATHIQQINNANRLFDSRNMPDKVINVLAIRKGDLSISRERAIKNLITQHFNALKHYKNNVIDTSYRIAKRFDLTPEQVTRIFRGLYIPDEKTNFAYLSMQDQRLLKTAQILTTQMKSMGLLRSTINLDRVFCSRFLPRGSS
jgi:NitT/TauT family transport system substrate-binding protein